MINSIRCPEAYSIGSQISDGWNQAESSTDLCQKGSKRTLYFVGVIYFLIDGVYTLLHFEFSRDGVKVFYMECTSEPISRKQYARLTFELRLGPIYLKILVITSSYRFRSGYTYLRCVFQTTSSEVYSLSQYHQLSNLPNDFLPSERLPAPDLEHMRYLAHTR